MVFWSWNKRHLLIDNFPSSGIRVGKNWEFVFSCRIKASLGAALCIAEVERQYDARVQLLAGSDEDLDHRWSIATGCDQLTSPAQSSTPFRCKDQSHLVTLPINNSGETVEGPACAEISINALRYSADFGRQLLIQAARISTAFSHHRFRLEVVSGPGRRAWRRSSRHTTRASSQYRDNYG
jgi:hypothetical protein